MSLSQSKPTTALSAADNDVSWLRDAFVGVQSNLSAHISLASQSISHAGTMGSVNEEYWLEVLRSYLPNRYDVASGIVVDSHGNRSDQIDIVVFDRHFTPLLERARLVSILPALHALVEEHLGSLPALDIATFRAALEALRRNPPDAAAAAPDRPGQTKQR